jgi:hypothetical protein
MDSLDLILLGGRVMLLLTNQGPVDAVQIQFLGRILNTSG